MKVGVVVREEWRSGVSDNMWGGELVTGKKERKRKGQQRNEDGVMKSKINFN